MGSVHGMLYWSANKQVISILNEVLVTGQTIIKSEDERDMMYSMYYERPYFLELYKQHFSKKSGDGDRARIKSCSQQIDGNTLSVKTKLEIESDAKVNGHLIEMQLKIPSDTYIVNNMICIPELLRLLHSSPENRRDSMNAFLNVLKIELYQEGDLLWNS